MELQEYDIVSLLRPLPEHSLPAGSKGTIVLDYSSAPPEYEVEFVDSNGGTIALVTLPGSDLEFVERS
jgi:hypothetical protein